MKEYNEQVVETLDDAGCIIANKNIIIDNLQARIAELEEENELLKGRKNVELAANTDNAKSKQQRELAGPMEMGQLLAGSTHKTSGDLEIERTKPVTWIHKGGGFISDSRGKFIGCFSGDFRYRDRIICAVNSESETSNQLAAAQEELRAANSECDLFRKNGRLSDANEIATLKDQLAAEQEDNQKLRIALDITKRDLIRMRCPDFFEGVRDGYEFSFDNHLVNMIGLISDYTTQE